MNKTFIFIATLFFSANLLAASNNVQRVNNDIIGIDGQYAARTMSPSERRKAFREKLEKRTEAMLRKKIEQVRVQHELELMKKIQQTFTDNMNAMDQAFAEDDDSSSNL